MEIKRDPQFVGGNMTQRIKNENESFASQFVKDSKFICVVCGINLSPAIPKFYRAEYPENWASRLLCYVHQQEEKRLINVNEYGREKHTA